MKEPRLYVDFNEMIEDDLVLLSKTDFKLDSDGNRIELIAGAKVKIYMDDIDDNGEEDNLIADGIVEENIYREKYSWTSVCKWNCRIDKKGIFHESDLD
ncbi:MAG: hypothetical protein K1X55_05615 [Chitinophagales bacterium]|nr:hypothetical protein [Chitinophagales bacterium]